MQHIIIDSISGLALPTKKKKKKKTTIKIK